MTRPILATGAIVAMFACLPYRPQSESGKYTPEVQQPSQERINELAQLPPDAVKAAPLPRTMRIEVSPTQIIEGRPLEVRCFVPYSPLNRAIKLAVFERSFIEQMGLPQDLPVYTLSIQHAMCGTHEALCAVARADRDEPIVLPIIFKVHGECNAESR